MQANSRLTIDATVQGVRADGAAYGCYRLNASFFRTATGAGTQIGATTVIYSRESNAALNATLTVVNSFPTVQVIDGAQGTIVWDVWIQGFS
jgi:hypothetical protein